MIRPRGFAAGIAALALPLLAVLPAGAQPTPAAPPQGSTEQRQTITDIRNVGTAMFVWYKDQLKTHPKGKTEKVEPESRPAFDRIPPISHDDLAKLLVPTYIAAIPEKDGWGHPYEFHLNTADLYATTIMGLRSTGRDGQFSGDSYEVGAFPPADQDQDVAWMDGYFVRWPQPAAHP
jgi:hypothetical protein